MSTPLHVHADHHPTVEAEHQVVLSLSGDTARDLATHVIERLFGPGAVSAGASRLIAQWTLRLDPETALDLARAIRWEAEAYDECNRGDCHRAALRDYQCIPHHDETEATYRPDPQRAHPSTPDLDHQAGATALSLEWADRLTGDAS